MTTSATARTPPIAAGSLDISEADTLERMAALFSQYGDSYQIRVPDLEDRAYVLHHPDDVGRVLAGNQRSYVKGTGIERVTLLLGAGSMTAEGETWRTHRAATQPLMHARSLERFDDAIITAQHELVARWTSHADRGATLDIVAETSRFAADVICSAIFGEDVAVRSASRDLLANTVSRDAAFAYRFRSLGTAVLDAAERSGRGGIMTMLMDAGLAGRALVDEVLTLLVAGYETVAAALAWTWSHAADFGEAFEGFAEAAVKEAMRLRPPGWLLTRRAIASDVVGGFDVPSGTHLLIPVFLVHRDARHWKDPQSFVPRRFAPDAAPPARFSYLPFGAGLRHCVGESFAMREMTMHLSDSLQRFRLRRVDSNPIRAAAGINLRPAHPVMMRVERRL